MNQRFPGIGKGVLRKNTIDDFIEKKSLFDFLDYPGCQ